MKKITLLLAAVAIAACTFGQSPLNLVTATVGNADILKNWDLGETKYVNTASIQRLTGENDMDHRTNVFYTSNKSMTHNFEANTSKEMIVTEERYLQDAPGGQLSLFFDRNVKTLANPALFTVLVKDPSGKIIFTHTPDSEKPYYYQYGIWYYYTTINLPVNVGTQFTVEVADAGTMTNFTFLVTNWENADEYQKFAPLTKAIL